MISAGRSMLTNTRDVDASRAEDIQAMGGRINFASDGDACVVVSACTARTRHVVTFQNTIEVVMGT